MKTITLIIIALILLFDAIHSQSKVTSTNRLINNIQQYDSSWR